MGGERDVVMLTDQRSASIRPGPQSDQSEPEDNFLAAADRGGEGASGEVALASGYGGVLCSGLVACPAENRDEVAMKSRSDCGASRSTALANTRQRKRSQMPSTFSTNAIFARSGIAQTVEWTFSGE